MAIIEPVREDIERPGEVKKNSASIRFWHWANFTVISGSLITVLINSTLLKGRSAAAFVQAQLQKAGLTVTANQARSVSHAMADKVWAVHIYFGYVLAALFLFRLLLEAFQLADQKMIRKIKKAHRNYFIVGTDRKTARHELFVKWLYVAFYVLLLIMVVTGLTLAFDDDLGISRQLSHLAREVHSFCMYLVLAFIVVHLVGVFLAERGNEKGIVSDMINGGGNAAPHN